MKKIYVHSTTTDGRSHFRAVEAEHISGLVYLILPQPYNPAMEIWEFLPSTKVKCSFVSVDNKTFLFAAEAAD